LRDDHIADVGRATLRIVEFRLIGGNMNWLILILSNRQGWIEWHQSQHGRQGQRT